MAEFGVTRHRIGLLGGLSAGLACAVPAHADAQNAGQPAADDNAAPPAIHPRQQGPAPLLAQARARQAFNIPAQPLPQALAAWSEATGVQVLYSEDPAFAGRSRAVTGEFSAKQALTRLLSGSGIAWRFTAADTVTLSAMAGAPALLDPINVEGRNYAGLYQATEGFKAEFQTSATKIPLAVRETPQAVSVITQDELEARQVTDLGQALETAAGVSLYSGTGPFAGLDFGLGAILIRGFNTDGLHDVRVDGFISPIFGAQPDLAPYQRIEVVKGPSSLYGRGSAGGFVNRVTKKPLPEYHADIEVSAGSFDFYRAEADVGGPLFQSGTARGRLVLAYQDSESFVDFLETETVVAAPSFAFDFGDDTRLLVQGIYQRDEFVINPGFPLARQGGDFRAPDVDRSLFFGVPSDEESTNEILSSSLRLDHDISDDWLATLRVSHGKTEHRSTTDNYGSGVVGPTGDVSVFASAFNIDNDVWSGELRLTGNIEFLERPATVAVGVDHSDAERVNDQFFAVLGTANIYQENFDQVTPMEPTRSFTGVTDAPATGVYGLFQFRPAARWSVLVGARYDDTETLRANRVAGTQSEREDDALTGRLGVIFDLSDTTSLYAQYAQSFQPEYFAMRRGGGLLEPTEGDSYEVGLKAAWMDGRLGLNAAVFRIELDDVPIADPSNAVGEFFSINGGAQRSQGVELEVSGRPGPGWRLTFAGTLLDTELVERDGRPYGVADWQLGLFTDYVIQDGRLRDFGLGAGVFAIGDRSVGPGFPDAELEGYERVDLYAFYQGFDRVGVRLQVRNLFDERYVEASDRVNGFNQFGAPTAVVLEVNYELDD